jgi:hypothetical protein
MDVSIAAEVTVAGAYDLGAFHSSVKLARGQPGASEAIDRRRDPSAEFDPHAKIAELVLDPRRQEPQVQSLRGEILAMFVKRAAVAQAIHLDRVERRASGFDKRAQDEKWSEARIEREQDDLVKQAMGGRAAVHGLARLTGAAQSKPDPTEMYLRLVQKGASIGVTKQAFVSAAARFGLGAIKGLARAGWNVAKGVAKATKWAVTPHGGLGMRHGGINPIVNPLSWIPGTKGTKPVLDAAGKAVMEGGKPKMTSTMFAPGRIGQAVQEAGGVGNALAARGVGAGAVIGAGATGYFALDSARRAARPFGAV